jgi:hypothetical protein
MNGFDWQFVIVTLAALWGAWVLLRPFLPSRKGKPSSTASGACARCSAGTPCASKTGAKEGSGLVTLGSGRRASRPDVA